MSKHTLTPMRKSLYRWLNLDPGMLSYQSRNYHYKDKTVPKQSCLCHNNPYNWKDGNYIGKVLESQF